MRFAINEAQEQNDPLMVFTMHMLHAVTNAHILHWTRKGPGADAAHRALGIFYDELSDKLDGFIESFQGKYGQLHDFIADYKLPPNDPLAYVQSLKDEVETLRRAPGFPQDSELQNEVDNIANLINVTILKLRDYQ
jgi:hypothetical protein